MEKQTHELNITKEELNNSINIKKTKWQNKYTTNCYAYALGLDIPQKKVGNYAYDPGFTSKKSIFLPSSNIIKYEDLINNIYIDLNTLGIDYKETEPSEQIKNNEWKIALFLTIISNNITDYHFLRQTQNGIWYHKKGWLTSPTKYDDNHQIITSPKECYLKNKTYNKCLKLKLK